MLETCCLNGEKKNCDKREQLYYNHPESQITVWIEYAVVDVK